MVQGTPCTGASIKVEEAVLTVETAGVPPLPLSVPLVEVVDEVGTPLG